MTITTVSYQKTYNLGNYSSERIGVEVSINEGENAMEALDTAKKLCQEFHDKNNPEPFVSGETIIQPASTEPIPEIKVDKRTAKEIQEQKLISDINSCTEIKVLESYRLIAKSNEKLQTAYDLKMEQLSQLHIQTLTK